MKIAVSPDPEHWVVIPSFPPPGWAREEARRRAYLLGVTSPLWRNEFESLLGDLLTVERTESLARLLHAHSVRDKPFVVDMSLLRAGDNGTKEGRRRTQMGLVTDVNQDRKSVV